MKLRKIKYSCVFLTLLLLLVIQKGKLYAQSEPMFTQYSFNEIFINPAYTGSHEMLSLSSLYRKQWVNINGAPTTLTFTAHSPVFESKIGLGLTAYRDVVGVTAQTGLFANYAYRIKTNKGTLAFGLLGGFNGYSDRLSEIQTNDAGDEEFTGNSPVLFAPNFGFGTYYHTERFYFGLSVPRLIHNQLKIGASNTIEAVEGSFVKEELHVFLASGFIFNVNPALKLRPSAMVKMVMNAPVEYDLNLAGLIYQSVWIGGGYRSGDAWNLMAAIQANPQFRIGYSYDYTFTRLRTLSGGTHEVSLNYLFNYKKSKITSPRYF